MELSLKMNIGLFISISFHNFKFNIILKTNIWITTLSITSILISIKSYLNSYTVHSLKSYDITTKIAFTKNQLSPDNSWISLYPISSKNYATFTCSVWHLDWARSSGFGSYVNNSFPDQSNWNSCFIYELIFLFLLLT